MNQFHKMKHLSIVLFLIFSTGFASFCSGQNSVKAGAYVRYSVKAGQRLEVIVGVFLNSKNEIIHVFDLKTFSERKIDPKNVLRKKVPISESEAASRVGIAAIVAWNLKDLIPKPPKPGKVAEVDGAVAYLNLGKDSGIRVGSKLVVFRGESVIKDPATGEVIGKKRRKVATVEVLEVRDRLSKVKLLGKLELKLKIGDVVETNWKSRSIAVLSGTNAAGATLKSGIALSDEITSALSKFKVSIVERTKLIDVVHELALQRTGIFDKTTIQKLGSQVGAYAVLSITIIPSGQKSKVSVRLVEVETGKILYALAVETKALNTSVTSSSSVGNKPVIASALGHWSFENSARNSLFDKYHGRLEGGAKYAKGRHGNALSLDGSNGLIRVEKNADLEVGASDFSVVFWINLNNISSDVRLCVSMGSSVRQKGWKIAVGNGGSILFASSAGKRSSSARARIRTSSNTVKAGKWYHIAVSVKRGRRGNRTKIYVDGKVSASGNVGFGDLTARRYSLCFGKGFDGRIDEAWYFKRALTAKEVRSLAK